MKKMLKWLTTKRRYAYDVHFEGTCGEGGDKNEMLWGVDKCSGCPVFIFLLKKIGFPLWPDVEPNVNVLLTKSLPFDSDVREWSHLLMIPLYCFWVYQTIERLVNLNVMWLWLLKVRSGNISELILKTKADLKDGSDNSSHP